MTMGVCSCSKDSVGYFLCQVVYSYYMKHCCEVVLGGCVIFVTLQQLNFGHVHLMAWVLYATALYLELERLTYIYILSVVI